MMYGFWEYDLFPHCVGGELSGPVPGKPGYWYWLGNQIVAPFLVMGLRDGRKIQAHVDRIKREKAQADADARKRYCTALLEFLPVPRALKEVGF